MQQKFFDWVTHQKVEKNLISLNLGLILNSELHMQIIMFTYQI